MPSISLAIRARNKKTKYCGSSIWAKTWQSRNPRKKRSRVCLRAPRKKMSRSRGEPKGGSSARFAKKKKWLNKKKKAPKTSSSLVSFYSMRPLAIDNQVGSDQSYSTLL